MCSLITRCDSPVQEFRTKEFILTANHANHANKTKVHFAYLAYLAVMNLSHILAAASQCVSRTAIPELAAPTAVGSSDWLRVVFVLLTPLNKHLNTSQPL
jgi:hypothetical protein